MDFSQKASGFFGKLDWKDRSLQTILLAMLSIVLGRMSPAWGPLLQTMGSYALAGALGNWLALSLLFEKVPGLRGSSLIALKFDALKPGIRRLVMKEFFTPEKLERFLGTHAFRALEADIVIQAIDRELLFEKLLGAVQNSPFGPMLAMFGGIEGVKKSLRQPFEQKIEEAIREIVASPKFGETLHRVLTKDFPAPGWMDKIEDMVQSRLDDLTPEMLQGLIQDLIRPYLSWLVVWGGLFGALWGLGSRFF